MRYARQSLAEACFEVTRGDPYAALLLALDIERISRRERYPLDHKFGGPEPKGRGAACEPSTSSPLSGSPRGTPLSGLLIDLEDAA